MTCAAPKRAETHPACRPLRDLLTNSEPHGNGDERFAYETLPSLARHVPIARDEMVVEHHRSDIEGCRYVEVVSALGLDPSGVELRLGSCATALLSGYRAGVG